MTVSVHVYSSARGKLSQIGKSELEISHQAPVDDLRRALSEKYEHFAKAAEDLRLFQSGVLIKEEKYRDAVDERNPYRAVFVERKNRTHVDELKPFVGLTTGGAQITIRGVNFANTVRMVKFGAVQVEAVRYSPEVLTCIAPPHDAGVVSVEVEAPGEGFTDDGSTYTYVNSIAEGAEIAIAACDERKALAPMSLESCKPVNTIERRRDR
uniref:IPT/TIG domain-containing protein n=1 Tax=Rhodosorus marinus TaxID=101924 RepID=A0A7S0G0V4_9RHOD|mmetsp:Transcript_10187/g.14738  ORF Transcript_10187/g.14738 Transcript_10187/m.14738 type:complete len:210 (+) Transcript_10187:153-782(+)